MNTNACQGHGTHSLQLRANFSNNCNIKYSLMIEAGEQFTLSEGQDPFQMVVILTLILAEWIFQTKAKAEKTESRALICLNLGVREEDT